MMELLFPFSAFFGLVGGAVLILYFLRMRRVEVVIPSTYLWRKAVQDLRANAPFQRLRRNLLLLVQLLILALITLGLMRPVASMISLEGNRIILLIDRSASMNATDREPSRLALAKREAISVVRSLDRGDQAMVIAFGRDHEVVCPFTDDRRLLEERIEAILPSDTGTELSQALRFAATMAAGDEGADEIRIFSDGRAEVDDDISLGRARPKFIRIGDPEAKNLGLTAMRLHRNVEDGRRQLFVNVRNFSPVRREVELEIRHNQRTYDARRLTLEANGQTSVTLDNFHPEEGQVEARLLVEDDLETDNWAGLFLPRRAEPQVLLVTAGNLPLATALEAVRNINLEVQPPAWLETGEPEAYDLVIFDRVAPETAPTGISTCYIGVVPPLPGFEAEEERTELTFMLDWISTHPVARFIPRPSFLLEDSLVLTVPDRCRLLAEARETPLIVSYTEGLERTIVLSFSVIRSNWPLKSSFSIFWQNAVHWLTEESRRSGGRVRQTGQPLELISERPEGEGQIIDPGGRRHRIEFRGRPRAQFSATERQGLYRYRAPEGDEEEYLLSLCDERESDIAVSGRLTLGGTAVEVRDAGGRQQTRELWRWLALGGLVLLCLEWLLYIKKIHL